MAKIESVRLVIWDLDDTFWHGTLMEGGISKYDQRNHHLVIELANRGIVSSICADNDRSAALSILDEHKALEYFVLPSIAWEPKAARIAHMIEVFQLRASSVMFIDDNPNHRAEAKRMLPDLHVEDEKFIPRMRDDPRFRSNADYGLSRLKQYKLLERSARAEPTVAGPNEDFLRACDIRVSIDFDVEKSLDRAIELINKTDQLNFTKQRLSDDLGLARRQLSDELKMFDRQAGLVRVADNHGDYGHVGFFMTSSIACKSESGLASTSLRHFCFSCHTLGMSVERWVYNYLGRPKIDIVGEVLANLKVERNIDWIRQTSPASASSSVAPLIFILGGFEAQAIGVYLRSYTRDLRIVSNYTSIGTLVRLNSALLAQQTCCLEGSESLEAEANTLGLELSMHARNAFKNAPDGALYVFNLGLDYHDPRHYLRHNREGWRFAIEPDGLPQVNFLSVSSEDLTSRLNSNPARYSQEVRNRLLEMRRHIHDNYELEPRPTLDERVRQFRQLIERIPTGSKCIFIVDHDKQRAPNGEILDHSWIAEYRKAIESVTSNYPFVGVLSMSDLVTADTDMTGANHYAPPVYRKCATKIIDVAARLTPRNGDQTRQQGFLAAARSRFSMTSPARQRDGAGTRR